LFNNWRFSNTTLFIKCHSRQAYAAIVIAAVAVAVVTVVVVAAVVAQEG